MADTDSDRHAESVRYPEDYDDCAICGARPGVPCTKPSPESTAGYYVRGMCIHRPLLRGAS